MRLFSLILVLLAGGGCGLDGWQGAVPGSPETRPACESAPTSRPCVGAAETRPWSFEEWARAKSAELSKRFGVPVVPTAMLDEPSPCSGIADFHWGLQVKIFTVGTYDREAMRIKVWARDGAGFPFGPDDLMDTWIHEWIHHYDYANRIPPPCGEHVLYFQRRAILMGICP